MMPNPICVYFTLLISFFCCMCVFASIKEIQNSTILEIFESMGVWEVVCLLVHATGTDRALNMELESAALTGRYTSFGNDSRTMADTDRCFGTGFACKILPRSDLAIVGNPLYFKIEMDFLGRSQSSSAAKSFECGKMFVFFVFFFSTSPYNNVFSSPQVWWFVSPPWWALSHNSTAIMVSEFHPTPLPSNYVLHAEFRFYVLFCFSTMMDLAALLTNARSCSFDESAALVCVCCQGSDGHTSAHIFLDCCPYGLVSLAASSFSFFRVIFNFFLLSSTVFFPPQCYTAVYVDLLTALFLTFK